MKSWLPEGGANLFQAIKAVRDDAVRGGVRVKDLSIGQPGGPALESASKAAAEAVLSRQEAMHEYQDNGSPGVPGFAERFVAGHVNADLSGKKVGYVPIPGIKPMLAVVIQACGAGTKVVATTTNPGYPTPKVQAEYLGKWFFEPTINPDNGFLFAPQELDCTGLSERIGLVMLNYPHNPSGAGASEIWMRSACHYCERTGKRLFNDAAYAFLSYGRRLCLADVAWEFPDLSWAEAFSASKLGGNMTGWRVGAMVGSPDFIGDIKIIKGNTDSGFCAPMAAGALYALEHDQEGIQKVVDLYARRASLLCDILQKAGMRLALKPQAGFFTLWQTPKRAFGQEIRSAEDFNYKMIQNTGLVGVHFDPYMRYAVASADVEAIAPDIRSAFEKAEVSY